MKANSCLYRAVFSLCRVVYGLDISDRVEVFDRCNTGNGIQVRFLVDVIDEALLPYGLEVSKVYGNIVDYVPYRSRLQPAKDFVPSPCIAIKDDHATAVLGNECVNGAQMALVIERQ